MKLLKRLNSLIFEIHYYTYEKDKHHVVHPHACIANWIYFANECSSFGARKVEF